MTGPLGCPFRTFRHGEGKAAASAPGGEMEQLVRHGWTVVAPDVIGVGEIGPGMGAVGKGPPRLWYGYALLGKSMVGRQVRDVAQVVRFARDRFAGERGELAGLARAVSGPLLLHAAVFEDAFDRIALIDAPVSYRSLVMTRRYVNAYIHAAVPSALTRYDLPDLAACLAPRSLLVLQPRDGAGALADAATLDQDTRVIRAASAARDAAPAEVAPALAEWLRVTP